MSFKPPSIGSVSPSVPTRSSRKDGTVKVDTKSKYRDHITRRRGRPKVMAEDLDESAADRRRTQVRKAQQAYRQRKETTSTDLRRHVSSLTETVQCMNKTFQECRDRLSDAGLTESQTRDLTKVAMYYRELMESIRPPTNVAAKSRETHTNINTLAETAAKTMTATATYPADQPLVNNFQEEYDWLDHTLKQSQVHLPHADLGTGCTPHTPDLGNLSVLSYTQPPLPATQPATFDSATPKQQASLPQIYALNENSLARRLHRVCLEDAYHLLLDPNRRPHTYERVFRFSLLRYDRVHLVAMFKHMLDYGADEPFDFWDVPQIRIGGAGSHYPHKHGSGAETRKPVLHLGKVGLQMLGLLQNAMLQKTADLSVEVTGFEGEWFDPYDLEGYLEERGIQIDPTVSFVEAEIKESPRAKSEDSSPATVLAARAEGDWNSLRWPSSQQLNADTARWEETIKAQVTGAGSAGFLYPNTRFSMNPESTSVGMPEIGGEWRENVTAAAFEQSHEQVNQMFSGFGQAFYPPKPKKTVIIDVAKFVQCLTATGICLGKTPGFKRQDVDHALHLSSFDLC